MSYHNDQRQYPFPRPAAAAAPLDQTQPNANSLPYRAQRPPQPGGGGRAGGGGAPFYQLEDRNQNPKLNFDPNPNPHPPASSHSRASSRGSTSRGPGALPHPPPPDSSLANNNYNYPLRDRSRAYPLGAATGPAAAHSLVTPGADNYSDSASGGMAGIAYTVAERNARESGVQAMEGAAAAGRTPPQQPQPPSHHPLPLIPPTQSNFRPQPHQQQQDPFATESDSYSSLNSLGTPTRGSPGHNTPREYAAYPVYSDDPYALSRPSLPEFGVVNPNLIEDDDDDGLGPARSHRPSWRQGAAAVAGGVGAAKGGPRTAAAGPGGAMNAAAVPTSGAGAGADGYGPIGADTAYGGGGGGGSAAGVGDEKAAWPSTCHQSGRKKALKWAIIVFVLLAILGAILGSLYGTGVFGRIGGDASAGDGDTAAEDTAKNGDLSIGSGEIQALLNNPGLHKVFPGIDYTPINTQYPSCLSNPPSQNNVTRDMAVLSQLTNEIRLYGTDCNQTEMVLHAISQLKMQDTIKVWLGVWQDGNTTTNARQLAQLWDILDTYGERPFAGLIVANEILFRQQMTVAQLGDLLSEVKQNLTGKGMSLPVSTSDLGEKWDSSLNGTSDMVMANIHPFFAGVPASEAASWTWNFWSGTDGTVWRPDTQLNVIAETGWPTSGGTDCGAADTCAEGSVASVDGLNRFMDDWVCQALANGTRYFWFEAFDEPWKIQYDTKGKAWEDQWGLMDVNRNLKDGVKIPDCGGKTV